MNESMVISEEQNKVIIAINWIKKLANGINPIDGRALPDSDIVNNVHVSRCLFYVSHLLENIEESKPSKHKQYELDFQLTPEDAAKVTITDKTGITMFVKEINKVIPENMKPLAVSKVAQWLVSIGYLEEREKTMVTNTKLQLNSEHPSESLLPGKMEHKGSILLYPMMPTRSTLSLRTFSSYSSISPRFSIFS